jgi:hypothetical protein
VSATNNYPCNNPTDQPLFYSDSMTDQLDAAAKCLDCPFMVRCGVLGENEAHGVWGGVTEWERPHAKIAEAKRLKAAEEQDRVAFREEVVRLINSGKTYREIAVMLRTSLGSINRARDAHGAQQRRNAAKAAGATAALSAA